MLYCRIAKTGLYIAYFVIPDGAKWSVIEELLVIFNPFAIATTVLSGSSYGIISIVSPLIHKFCSNLMKRR